jgi:hypothetical protein
MFNVITPLARFNNLNDLTKHLSNKGIRWHVITDIDSNQNLEIENEWTKHYICPNEGQTFWERCNFSINWFIENQEINDDEYYCILNDDDGYENDFFNKIKKYIYESESQKRPNDLIICSMLRGHNTPMDAIPVRRHPTNTLFARPDLMTVGNVGVEQFIVKGKILKNHRLPLTTCGDGELISLLVKLYDTLYLPEVYVWFNYFEPGRWNK